MLFTMLRAFLTGDYTRVTRADLLSLTMSDTWIEDMRRTWREEV